MTDLPPSLYDQLVDLATIIRDVKPTKGETILKVRQRLDEILAEVCSDVSEGEVYRPGYSIVINEDEEDDG